AVVLAAMRVHGTDAVMAAGTAADLDAYLAGGKVELVVEHDDIRGGDLVEAHRFADRLTGKVHEGLGLEQQHLLVIEATLGDEALELLRPGREGAAAGDSVHRQKTDIVPVVLIFGAGIAEADK